MSNLNMAVKTVLSGQEIPLERTRANQLRRNITLLNERFNKSYELLLEQKENLIPLITDAEKKMYPDRFTDNSTPALTQELETLNQELKDLNISIEFQSAWVHETSILLNKLDNQSIGNALGFQNISYRGM